MNKLVLLNTVILRKHLDPLPYKAVQSHGKYFSDVVLTPSLLSMNLEKELIRAKVGNCNIDIYPVFVTYKLWKLEKLFKSLINTALNHL